MRQLEEFFDSIGVHPENVYACAANVNQLVRVTYRKKRDGSTRKIVEPLGEFKELLRRVDKRYLRSFPVHDILYHKKGSSHTLMAHAIASARYLMTVDIDEFYPSIQPEQIRRRLHEVGCCRKLANLIIRLTTFNKQLPQGFPTSPAMAAIVLNPVAVRLAALGEKHGFRLGIYADNIAISAHYNLRKFRNLVTRIFRDHGYRLQQWKLMASRERQEIMGIVVNRFPSIPREVRDELKSSIRRFARARGSLSEEESSAVERSPRGKLSYVQQVNADQAASLRRKARELGVYL